MNTFARIATAILVTLSFGAAEASHRDIGHGEPTEIHHERKSAKRAVVL